MRKASAAGRRPLDATTEPAEVSSSAAASARVSLRFSGSIADLDSRARAALFDRSTSSDAIVRKTVAAIVERVRANGDAALREMAREFDGADLCVLEVPRAACAAALDRTEPALRRALERAARNIASVHQAFLPVASETSPEPGIIIGRRPDPLGRVGIYAPGGRAAYPSSVLMGAVPARVAGVGETVLCSPPGADGKPSQVVLAAAALAGVDRVFALGGAGAIAAMAYGTDSVPRADRIVGPGNAYVAEAKLQVAGAVAIDAPAGPSEVLVVCDTTADVQMIAREMLAQAEHDPLACALAVVFPVASAASGVGEATPRLDTEGGGKPGVAEDVGTGPFIRRLENALAKLVVTQPRADVIRESLAGRGGILVAASAAEAVAFANDYAAEHVIVIARDEQPLLDALRHAGTVFVGASSSNAFGDYMTGANHVLPTGGLARSYSGLSVLDFFRWTTYQRIDPDAATRLSEDVGTLADAEGLPGHAAAARAYGATSGEPGLDSGDGPSTGGRS